MSNPLEIIQTLGRDLPPFHSGLVRGLRLSTADQREIAAVDWHLWTPWTVATFSGGESNSAVYTKDPSVSSLSKRAWELLGIEVIFDDAPCFNMERGELSQRAQELGAKKDPGSRGRFDMLTTACVRFLITSCALMGATSQEWRDQVPLVPQTRIDADRETGKELRIRFPVNKEFKYLLHTPPESVVTFGPGMTGSTFVGDMSGRTKNVHLVSGGSSALFVRKWAQAQLQQMAEGLELMRRSGELVDRAPGLPPDQVRLPETFYYDDGIAASIGIIASHTVERGKPVDIVVMSSVHSAGRQEIEAGVDGAHQLLSEGGLRVVKAPRASIGDEGGMDVVASQAIPLFGSPVASGEAGQLAQHIDPSLPLSRPADFAIFQKQ